MEIYIHIFFKNDFIKTVVKTDQESDSFSIGRTSDNYIFLPFDELISRSHAKVKILNDRIEISDCNSKNGVLIDGKKVEKGFIRFEKKFFLGNSSILFSKSPFKEIRKTLILDENLLEEFKNEVPDFNSEKPLSMIYKICRKISFLKDEDELLEELFSVLIKMFNLDRVLFFEEEVCTGKFFIKKLIDTRQNELKADYSESLIKEVISTQKAVFLKNVSEETDTKNKTVKTIGINSLIAVPVFIKKEIKGIIQAEYFIQDKNFSEQDFYVICIFCQILSGILGDFKMADTLKKENRIYKEELYKKNHFIGNDQKTVELKELIRKVAPSSSTVLITGESGTGKELIARLIHKESSRKEKPLIVINCASVPEHLIESELFGHMKGAFTGACEKRTGKLEAAGNGTIFLDEIGDMPLNLQTRLLRFLESGEIQPVGSNETRFVNVRVIAATNKDLKKAIEKNSFREDLFYRLCVINIHCPPLRERKKDILELVEFFLKKFSLSCGKSILKVSPEAKEIFLSYPWPGNIRELKNIIERACVIGEGEYLTKEMLSDNLKSKNDTSSGEIPFLLEDIEKEHIMKVLKECGNNRMKTANSLGITRKTLYMKLKKYGFNV